MSKKRILEGGSKIRNSSIIGQGGKQVKQADGSFAKGAIQAGKGPNESKPKGPTP